MEAGGSYICAINAFDLNFLYVAIPGVPIRANGVWKLRDSVYKDPTPMRNCVVTISDPEYDPLQHKGALGSQNPEEDRIAWLAAFVKGLSGPYQHDWIKTALSTPVEFRPLVPPATRMTVALKLRHTDVVAFTTTGRTAFQRAIEIVRVWQ